MKVTNTQNVPRDPRYRNLIIPRNDGEILIEGDLSQAEARVVAWKAKDTTLMNLFRRGEKVHEYVASLIFEKRITKSTARTEYEIGKTIAHASNYGVSPRKITEIVLNQSGHHLPLDKARHYQNVYFQQFPGIRSRFQQSIRMELNQNFRTLRTPLLFGGWKRRFFSPWGDELLRQAFSHYAQNVVAFVTNLALIRLSESPWKDSLYMQVHDAVVLSVPEGKLLDGARALKDAMTTELTIEGEPLVIPVEIKYGKRWGEMIPLEVE